MKLHFSYWFIIISLFLLFNSCSILKQKKDGEINTSNDSIPLKTSTNQKNNNSSKTLDLTNNQINYQWFSTRIQAVIGTAEESQSIQLFVVNKKDSIIYVNISKFFIEVSRAVITRDSVKFMNKIDMTYYVGDYSIFHKLFGVNLNFDMMQSLFIASDFREFDNNFVVSDGDSTITYSAMSNVHKKDNIKINQSIVYSKSTKSIYSNSIEDISTQQKAIITYAQYQTIDSLKFPQYWQIEIPGVKMKASFFNESLRFNVEGPTSIRIPDRYKPISFGSNE